MNFSRSKMVTCSNQPVKYGDVRQPDFLDEIRIRNYFLVRAVSYNGKNMFLTPTLSGFDSFRENLISSFFFLKDLAMIQN